MVNIVGVCFPPARQGASDGSADPGSWDEGSAGVSWNEWHDKCPGTGHEATYGNDAWDGYDDAWAAEKDEDAWDGYDDAWAAEQDEDLDGQPCPLIANLSTSGSNDFAAEDI